MKIKIWTGGVCAGSSGPGGWAAIVLTDKGKSILKGGELETTKNRMDLLAPIRALEGLAPGRKISVYSDSQYLTRGMNEWVKSWQQNGWATRKRVSVKNKELWQQLVSFTAQQEIAWEWLQGRTRRMENEEVLNFARQEMEAHRLLADTRMIDIWVGGVCRDKSGPGGWAALINQDEKEKILKDGAQNTTHDRLLLLGLIRALESLTPSKTLTIRVDSEYIYEGITRWISYWQQNGWLSEENEPIKDEELWQRLAVLGGRHRVQWQLMEEKSVRREKMEKIALMEMEESRRLADGDIVKIWTDGACAGNPGPGGWAAMIITKEGKRILKGGETITTNNRMELLAPINALAGLPPAQTVILCADSEYVIRGMTEWLPNWQQRGWRTTKKEPIKHQELWQRLAALVAKHRVKWRWVKAHAGVVENEEVDAIAREALEGYRHGDLIE